MNHPTNPNKKNNNNQDDGDEKHRKRQVPADLDEPSKPQKTSRFLPTQPDNGVHIDQEASSNYQLESNFAQNLALALNPRTNDLVELRGQGNKPGNKKICTCKKTKCLNLHCECFRNRKYCFNCNCQDCENTAGNDHGLATAIKKTLQNNPTAFDSEIFGEEHKKGCTCKNIDCMKGYCVCKAHNVKCTNKCSCKNCKNPFGARDYGQIVVPGEVNNQASGNNMAQNVAVGQHLVPLQQQIQVAIQSLNTQTNYGTLFVDVHANESVNTHQLTPSAENSPILTAPSSSSSNNSNGNSNGNSNHSNGNHSSNIG